MAKLGIIFAKILAALLGAVVAITAAGLIAVHTDWGRERVRRLVEDRVSDILAGELRVGRIEGSLLRHLILYDVVITDPEGRPAIRVARLEVRFSPLRLLRGELLIQEAIADEPRVLAILEPDRAMNLERLVPEAEPPPEPEPPPDPEDEGFRIRIDHLVLRDGAFTLRDRADTVVHLHDLDLEGRFGLAGGVTSVEVDTMTVELDAPPLGPARLAGRLDIGEDLHGRGLGGAVAGVLFRVPEVRFSPEAERLDAQLALEAPRGALGDFAGVPELLAALSLQGTVQRLGPGTPFEATLAGSVSGASTDLFAAVEPEREHLEVRLRVGGLDPAQLHAEAPAGALDLAVSAELFGFGWPDLAGTATLAASGWLEPLGPVDVERLELASVAAEARIADRRAEARLSAKTNLGHARVAAAARLGEERIVLEPSRVRLDGVELGVIVLPDLRLRGQVGADVILAGPLERLSARGGARASRLGIDDVRVRSAAARFELTGIPEAIGGVLHVETSGVAVGEIAVARAGVSAEIEGGGERIAFSAQVEGAPHTRHVDVRGTVLQEPERTRLQLAGLRAATTAGTWSAGPAELVLTEAGVLQVRDLVLTSTVGRLAVMGTANVRAPGQSPLGLRAEAELQVESLEGLLTPAGSGLAGHLVLRADVRREEDALFANAASDLRGFTFHGSGPVDADLRLEASPAGVSASLLGAGPALGRFAVAAELDAPRDLADPAAWEAGGLDLLRSGRVVLGDVRLGEVAALAGTPSALTGTVTAQLLAHDRLERLEFDLSGRGLRAAAVPLVLDLSAEGALHDLGLGLQVSAAVNELPVLTASAMALRTPAELKAGGLEALLTAEMVGEVRTMRLPVSELVGALAATATVPSDLAALEGTLTLDLIFEQALERLSLLTRAAGRGVVLRPGAPELNGGITARFDAGDLSAEGELRVADRGLVRFEGAAILPPSPLAPGAWAGVDEHALRSLELELDTLELDALVPFFPVPRTASGLASARVRVGPAAEDLEAHLRLRELRLSELQAPVDAELFVHQEPTHVEASFGTFIEERPFAMANVIAELTLSDLLEGRPLEHTILSGNLSMERFPLAELFAEPALRANFGGTADANVVLYGTFGAPVTDAVVDLSHATLAGISFERFQVEAHADPLRLTADASILQRPGGSLDLTAYLGLGEEEGRVEARLGAADFQLDFLSALAAAFRGPAAAVAGRLDGSALLGGTTDDPQLSGVLRLAGGRVLIPGGPPLESTEAIVSMQGDAVTFTASGRSGGGTFEAGLHGTFESIERQSFEARLITDDVRTIAGPLVVATDLDVTASGSNASGVVRVDAVIQEGTIRLPDERAPDLHPIRDLQDVVFVTRHGEYIPPPDARGPTGAPLLDLRIGLRNERPIVIRGRDAEATIELDVAMVSRPRGMALEGTASVRQGNISILDRRYEIQRGIVVFTGATPPNPRLDVRLAHDFDTLAFFVNVTGTAESPVLRFSSDPSDYDQSQLLSFFLGGSPDDAGIQRDGTVRDRAVSAAAGLLLGQVEGNFLRRLPFEVRFDLADAGEVGAGALTVGRWITDEVFVSYTYNFNAAPTQNVSEGLLRYRLFRAWLIELVFGDAGTGSADVLWVRRF